MKIDRLYKFALSAAVVVGLAIGIGGANAQAI